ncbi:MAG: FkbM family methyltransferase [Bacteroidales bacterium]|nr:FkbM family methyltransferase [Bacteroidales bacterium]
MNIFKFYLRKLLRPGIIEIEGIKIKIPKIASDTIRYALYKESYESAELKFVKNNLNQDDVIMEVGTGLGLLSAYCAKNIGDHKVFTFEAHPFLETAIKENYALNHVAPNLEMCLVGQNTGYGTFYLGRDFWSSSIYNKAQGAESIKVPVVSFNKKVREINPTFLFLDIEGGEYELVNYADFYNIKKLLIELHSWILSPEQIQFVKECLFSKGFHRVDASGTEEFYFER